MSTIINYLIGLTFILSLVQVVTVAEPTYSINYLTSFREKDLMSVSFGCSNSIAYGVYIYPIGAVDALYILGHSGFYNINGHCQRKDTYLKAFGTDQDYQVLISKPVNQVADHFISQASTGDSKKMLLDWKYPLQKARLSESQAWLKGFTTQMKNRGYDIYLKAPASYFCLPLDSSKYLIDVPVTGYVLEMYGQKTGAYTTYDSIFGQKGDNDNSNYDERCPKYPTYTQLKNAYQQKEFFIGKTLHFEENGYIGSVMEEFIQKAKSIYGKTYFYDSFPKQKINL